MEKIKTKFENVFLIKYPIYFDERGSFAEIYQKDIFNQLKIENNFIQDNISISKKGTLRGLHFQKGRLSQSKLLKVIKGRIIDCVVDITKTSKNYGKYLSFEISSEDNYLIYIGKGYAHGFLAVEDDTIISYKCDNIYSRKSESGILWNDKTLNIDWKLEKYNIKESELIISEKDKNNLNFNEIEV